MKPEGPRFTSFESSATENTDAKSDKKKSKAAKKAAGEAAPEGVSAADKKQAAAERLGKTSETLLQRLIGEKSAAKADKGDKPENAPAAAAQKEQSVEAADQTAPPEILTEPEQRLVASAYIAERQAQVAEAYEKAVEQGDAALAAELATDAVLLEAMQAELSRNPDEEPDDALEIAYDQTAQGVTGEAQPAEADEAAAAVPPTPPGTPPATPSPASPPPRPTPSNPPYPSTPTPSGSNGAGGASYSAANVGGAFGSNPSFNGLGPAAANTANLAPTVIEQHGGSALLVGGVIGYLIGRRRGRIKTEKRLGAVQEKLEKQMAAVQSQVFEKEERIKRLVRERQPQPTKLIKTEHLGLVSLQAAERAPGATSRRPEVTVPAREMQREELLAISKTIRVGETDLHRVYETRLISEQSLRQLVEIHQKGGDVRRELDRELLEKERSYERDPNLRNRAAKPTADSGGGSTAANRTLIAALGAKTAAAYTQREAQAAIAAQTADPTQKSGRRPQVDMAVAGGSVLLVVIVILIYMVLTH